MAELTAPERLGARLRALRQSWDDLPVRQRHVCEAFGLSGALISSWENGTALPSEDRLHAYARFFATRRSMAQHPARLVPSEDLTTEEERARSELIDDLVGLREAALGGPATGVRETGALGGRFWYFPDDQPITILCTPLSQRQLAYTAQAAEAGDLSLAAQYATNPWHPNAIRNLGNGDIDALLVLVGHIRAENPAADVKWLSYDRITSPDQIAGHLVLLGGGDDSIGVLPSGDISTVRSFQQELELPVRPRWPADADEEFGGEFVVTVDANGVPAFGVDRSVGEEVYRPRFARDEQLSGRPRRVARGAPLLTADVALLVRTRNPLNPSARLTILSGIFSRGTYGAVQAFVDPRFRTRNEQWLAATLDPEDFWLLLQVPVFAGRDTITPDLGRPANRLRMSS